MKPGEQALRKDPFKIELFLEKINQEMIRTTLPQSRAKCDIYGSWTKSCCILDFALQEPGEEVVLPIRDRGLLLRAEPGGGMMWDPRTGAVYKLSEAAYHALLDFDAGLSEREVARRNRVPLQAVKNLSRRLERITKS